MKSIGIIRKIDELGRIVIPMSIRQSLNMNIRDPLEIYVDGDRVVLRKHETAACVFCGEAKGVITFNDKYICSKCLDALKKQD